MLVNTLCIGNHVQNRDGDWYQNSINSWTQTWPNKYSLDCPSSRSWNEMDPGRVKCAIFSLMPCNCGLIKSPLLWMSGSWWDGENNTIYDLSSNHCFAYREGMACTSLPFWRWILMAVNQRCTDEEPLGLDTLVKNFFKCHTENEYMGTHFTVAMEGWRYPRFLFSISSLVACSLSLPISFQASNSIPQQPQRQQLHQANSIENTAQQRLLNRLEQPL